MGRGVIGQMLLNKPKPLQLFNHFSLSLFVSLSVAADRAKSPFLAVV